MRAGPLRHRIKIQKTTETQGTMGGVTDAWSTHVQAWASITPIVGKEYFAAREHQSETTHKVKLRWRQGVTPKMRVLYSDPRTGVDRIFDIESVINIQELNAELVLMCKEDLT